MDMPEEVWCNDYGGYYLCRDGDEQGAQECGLAKYHHDDKYEKLRKERDELLDVLAAVEKWWVGDKMGEQLGGAPSCIFRARSALAKQEKRDAHT